MPGSEPGSARGCYPGRRAGDRQRRAVAWVVQAAPSSSRVHPDDGPQRPGVVQAADQCLEAVRRTLHHRADCHVEHLRELAESSPSIVTPLNSAIGYEEAAAVAKQALKERKTIRQTVIDRGLIGDKLSIEELDRRLDVLAMAKVKPQ